MTIEVLSVKKIKNMLTWFKSVNVINSFYLTVVATLSICHSEGCSFAVNLTIAVGPLWLQAAVDNQASFLYKFKLFK